MDNLNQNILYITYDGLLDPLGASQILPYIKAISSYQNSMHVLSFEKNNKLLCDGESMLLDIAPYGIKWKPLSFTEGFWIFSKAWDLSRMYFFALFLAYKYNIQVVHARSNIPAQVGFFLKKIFNCKLIFDFRGLWVDEKIDKGSWDLKYWTHRMQYKYFKRVEKKILEEADQVVVLTQRVVNEVYNLGASPYSKITVIPCCADYDHFVLSTSDSKSKDMDLVGIPPESFVIGFLGSVGKTYMLDYFFRLFKLSIDTVPNLHALMITQDCIELNRIMKKNIHKSLNNRIHIKSASRNEVPLLLPAIDIMVNFVIPSYARMSMSPTKMAECFATGIPVISSFNIGDVDEIINDLKAGMLVNPLLDSDLLNAINNINSIKENGGKRLRNISRPLFGLEVANKRYMSVYEAIKHRGVN